MSRGRHMAHAKVAKDGKDANWIFDVAPHVRDGDV